MTTHAQRGDFVSPTASSFTDRRDADDAIELERLTRRVRMDVAVGPLPLGPADGLITPRVVQVVQVTYHREPGDAPDWLTDEVTLFGGDGTVMEREVDTRQRGHRTEGIYATLRWRRTPRLSRWDLRLGDMPEWLDDLVEAYRPSEPAPGTDTPDQANDDPGGWLREARRALRHQLTHGDVERVAAALVAAYNRGIGHALDTPDQAVQRVDYLCIGHPAWPDPLVVQTPERAQEWLSEHQASHPSIRVVQRTTIREPFAAVAGPQRDHGGEGA